LLRATKPGSFPIEAKPELGRLKGNAVDAAEIKERELKIDEGSPVGLRPFGIGEVGGRTGC